MLALMTFVKREQIPVRYRLSAGPILKEYLKNRCLKPGCPVGVVVFAGKPGTLTREST